MSKTPDSEKTQATGSDDKCKSICNAAFCGRRALDQTYKRQRGDVVIHKGSHQMTHPLFCHQH